MTDTAASSARLQHLRSLVVEALEIADELSLSVVAVRLEQARILMLDRHA